MAKQSWSRPLPTGLCWCGCEAETPVGAFFVQGHDKRAESNVIREVYGSVADFVTAHGYSPAGPNYSGKRKRGRK